LTIFVLAAVPSPLIDLAGIAAGTLRMPYRVYLVACVLGKVLRFIGFAWLGRLLV
jgi:membrane protein DedA with SNARE-associated domain